MLDIQWLSKTRSKPRCHGISMCIRSDSTHGCSSSPSCQENQKSSLPLFSRMQLLAEAVPIDECATWLLVGRGASVHGRPRRGWSAGVDDRSGARGSASSRCVFAIRHLDMPSRCNIPKFGNASGGPESANPVTGLPKFLAVPTRRVWADDMEKRFSNSPVPIARQPNFHVRLQGGRRELDLQPVIFY